MSATSLATLPFTMPQNSLEDISHWPGSATQSTELDISSPSALMDEDKLPYLGDDFGLKVRKPYTITKQRERWTDEEHQKFLDALKLYGRAWRRIEEHIGTKTTVQIRSHAQKFFCKVEREQSGGGTSTDMAVDIDIPPPRPKRKPNHPYPRKAGGSFSSSPTDMERNGSPSSVPLSYAAVKFVTPPFGEGYYLPTAIAPFSTPSKQGDYGMSDTTVITRPQPAKLSTSLKLFGQNVVVPTVRKSTDPTTTLLPIHAQFPSSENTPANSGESGRFFPTQCGSKDEAPTIIEANIGKSFSLFQTLAKLGIKPKAVPGRLLGEFDTGYIQKAVNSGAHTSYHDKNVLVQQDQESEKKLQHDGQDQSLNSPSALDASHHMKSTLTFNSHEAADSIEKSSDWKADGASTSKFSSHDCKQIPDFLGAIPQNLPFNSTGYTSVGPEHLATFQGIDSQVLHYSSGSLFGPWQWTPTNSENLAAMVMPGVFPMAVFGLPSLGIDSKQADISAAAAATIASASAWWDSRGIPTSNQFYPSMGPFYSPVGVAVLSASDKLMSSIPQSNSCQAEGELGQKLLVQTVQAENDSKDIVEESRTQVLTSCKNLDCEASSKASSLFVPTDSNQSAGSGLAKSSCNGSCPEANCEHISCQNKPGKRQQVVHLRKHSACERDQKRARRGSIDSSCTFVSEDVNSCLGTSDSGASLCCLLKGDDVNNNTGCDGTTSGDAGPSSTASGCENLSRNSDPNDSRFSDNAKDSACLTWRADGDIQSTTSKLQETLQTMEEKSAHSVGHLVSRTSIRNPALDSGERPPRSRADVGMVDGFPKHHRDAMSETELRKEVSDEGRMDFQFPLDFFVSSTSHEAGFSSNLSLPVHRQFSDRSVPANGYLTTNKDESGVQRSTSSSCTPATTSVCGIESDLHDRQEEKSPPASCSAFRKLCSSVKKPEVNTLEQSQKFNGKMGLALSVSIGSSMESQEGKLHRPKAGRIMSSITSKGGDSAFKGVGFVPYQRSSVKLCVTSLKSKDLRPS